MEVETTSSPWPQRTLHLLFLLLFLLRLRAASLAVIILGGKAIPARFRDWKSNGQCKPATCCYVQDGCWRGSGRTLKDELLLQLRIED